MTSKKIIFAMFAVLILIVIGVILSNQTPDPTKVAEQKNCETKDTQAPALEECSVKIADLKKGLNTASNLVATVTKDTVTEDTQNLYQSVTLKDGTTLTYSEGGCEHFSFEFSFSPYVGDPFSKVDWLKKAQQGLKTAIWTEHGEAQAAILVKALAAPVADSEDTPVDTLYLECGDASCELRMNDGTVTVRYDMAL